TWTLRWRRCLWRHNPQHLPALELDGDAIVRDRSHHLCTHSFSFTRLKTPISSCVKLSALPSPPIVKVVRVGACVAPGNCMTNAPWFQGFNVAGYFAGPHSTLSASPSSNISQRP